MLYQNIICYINTGEIFAKTCVKNKDLYIKFCTTVTPNSDKIIQQIIVRNTILNFAWISIQICFYKFTTARTQSA